MFNQSLADAGGGFSSVQGRFRFSERSLDDCVCIHMRWDGHRPAGEILVPDDVALELAEEGLPPTTGIFTIDNAVAYGLVISFRSGRALRLTGDHSVWPVEWGILSTMH